MVSRVMDSKDGRAILSAAAVSGAAKSGATRSAPQGNDRNYTVPATLTIRPGTYVTVHVNQWLSSDRSQQGDTFFASLAEPLVVDGVVVAQRGQTVRGRITEAQKAGRVEGTSRLGIELTSLTLVDGQQVNIHSQMVTRNGQTSVGRDAGAIAGTTALGAIVGAGADYGRGAAIGAGAGAAAGILGVLLTRGRPTEISPESMLTFQLEAPVTVATDRAPQAFRYAEGQDYGRGYSSYSQGGGPRPVVLRLRLMRLITVVTTVVTTVVISLWPRIFLGSWRFRVRGSAVFIRKLLLPRLAWWIPAVTRNRTEARCGSRAAFFAAGFFVFALRAKNLCLQLLCASTPSGGHGSTFDFPVLDLSGEPGALLFLVSFKASSISRSISSLKGIPVYSHIFGNMLIDVKPGMVLISLI